MTQPAVPAPRNGQLPDPAWSGRLPALLAAIGALSGEMSLPALLHRIVECACDLVEARYGALTVRDPEGGLAEFVHVGLPDDLVQRIGRPPGDQGLLGFLTQQTGPLRLADLTTHPSAIGFPAGHPDMRSFLGTPLSGHGEPFGHVCVTEKLDGGAFTAEDEELLVTLAGAASLAIANAQLRVTAARRRRWLEASTAITAELVAGEGDPLPLIVELTREVAGADLATLVLPVPDEPETLVVAAASGIGAELCAGLAFPRGDSLTGRALDADEDLNVRQSAGQTYLRSGLPLGPALVVRLRTPHGAQRGQTGALSLTRESGGRPFSDEELAMATSFASQVGLALQLREAQRNARLLDLLHERERIGEQLHDGVVRDLFGTVLALQSLAAKTTDPSVRAELSEHVLSVEATIRSIRRSVYNATESAADDWRQQVLELASRFASPLGGEPRVVLTAASADLDEASGQAVLTGMREVLGAVSRLPSVTEPSITITRAEDSVDIEVTAGTTAGTPAAEVLPIARRLPSGRVDQAADRVRVRWAVPLAAAR